LTSPELVDFVGFDEGTSFVEGEHGTVHLELKLAGIGRNGNDIAYGVAVGAKNFDEQICVDHGCYLFQHEMSWRRRPLSSRAMLARQEPDAKRVGTAIPTISKVESGFQAWQKLPHVPGSTDMRRKCASIGDSGSSVGRDTLGDDHGRPLMAQLAAIHDGTPLPYWDSLRKSAQLRVAGVSLLVMVGSLGMAPLWATAWVMWTHDPLRSIGMYFPWISLLGVLDAFRRTQWRLDGTFWGLPVIAFALLTTTLTNAALGIRVGIYGFYPQMLHSGVPVFCFGVGAVLLFGGPTLLKRAILPLCLLLAINPVPYSFTQHLDLTFQEISANTARAFAHRIGLQPTGAQLVMMFTPDFGMMIVPGCNGIRGAATLGYLALIFGYVRGMSKRVLALFAVGAVGLGYLLNLLRLCTLVVYYRIGMKFPSIQSYGAQVDYVIGCTLFLLATVTLGIVLYMNGRGGPGRGEQTVEVERPEKGAIERSLGYRSLAFVAVVIPFMLNVRADASGWRRPTEAQAEQAMPLVVGRYHLTRTWTETNEKVVNFVNGDYVGANESDRLTLGMWIPTDYHLAAACRRSRGEEAETTKSMTVKDADGLPVQFLMSYYDDGVTRSYFAESSCIATGCALE
jgi:exosortase J